MQWPGCLDMVSSHSAMNEKLVIYLFKLHLITALHNYFMDSGSCHLLIDALLDFCANH